jgi:NADH dehydrogenase
LPTFPQSLSDKAKAQLEDLGVEVRLDTMVSNIKPGLVEAGDLSFAAQTVIWAAGVKASSIAKCLDAPLDRAGRVQVEPDLTVPGAPDIYVLGDLALVKQRDGSVVPGVSPAAIQQGKYAANHILARLAQKKTEPFRYWNKGSFAVIGRGAAVGQLFRGPGMTGTLAWLMWLFIHVLYLVGFRNRAAVLFGWAYSYMTFRKSARLITGIIDRETVEAASVGNIAKAVNHGAD